MADGVAITAGSGTTIATDDCGVPGHAQIFKQAISTDGSATLVGATADGVYQQGPAAHDAPVAGNPLLLGGRADTDADTTAVSTDGDVARIMTDLQGRQVVRPLPFTASLAATSAGLTTATTAYSTGDQLGTQISIANAVRVSGGTGVIRGVRVLDKADVTGNIDVVFLRASITLAADNAAFAISDGDADSVIGTVNVPMVDYGNNRWGHNACYLPFDCSATTLYVALITRTGHTFFGATSDLALRIYVQQD